MSDPPPAAAIVHERAPLTEESAREVWESAMHDLERHALSCARCTSSLFRCDRGVALARAEGATRRLALASVEGEPST